MPDSVWPVIVIPGDDPAQLAGSAHLERLREHGEVTLYDTRPADDDEKIQRAKHADVMINSRGAVKWPAEVLAALPKLKMIALCGIGTDSVDLEAARRQGIVVANIPGKTAPVVAEHAFALMFAASRRAAFQTAELKAGRWTRRENIMLQRKTLGVVGTGAIGAEMARLANAIGMRVIAWTYRPSAERARQLGVEFVEFDELLARSDVVSLHVKLTDESRHLIGERELALMQPGSLLVNTARGAIVDARALATALNSGHLQGAAIDVFDVEPLREDDPLLDCEQVILTPHNADQTPEGIDLLNEGAVDNVIAYLRGEPTNVV